MTESINKRGAHKITVTQNSFAKFQATCSRCGRVGVAQDYQSDADVIGERHEALQGFEAVSS